MIVGHPLIGRRLFFPRPTHLRPSFYVEVEGAKLACYVRGRYRDAGTVLHFHGNGELASEYAEHHADMFLAMGVNVCFAEYRGYGLSTGTPALAAMLADTEAIARALSIPPERMVAFGQSLGTIYAIELAHRMPRLAGLILESGIADVRENWPLTRELKEIGSTDEEYARELAAHFDHRQKLSGYRQPLLVLHAAKDRTLDPSHAERLHAWAGSAAKKLVNFPHDDHALILPANYMDYVAEVSDFLQRSGITAPR
jgi:alpha-beta hydrolase superfamily lysophospholipase